MLPPGPRLPDALEPLAYELTLELDPDRAGFTGHVEIRVRATAPTDVAWVHAVELEITSATVRDAVPPSPEARGPRSGAPLAAAGEGEQMRGYRLPQPLAAGAETTLVFDYTGGTAHDEQGLFREQLDGRGYLFSQSESVFARRVLPCFDEPRWKPTWRVHLVVPHGQTALANAPELARHDRPDGAVAVDFAPTPPMPSYLLAVAVGPFDLVVAGTVGRAHVPLRVAMPAGTAARAAVVTRRLPAIVDALEAYFDDALPVAKLDIVDVPHFFGGMENPGLVTMSDDLLVGDPDSPDNVSERRTFQRFAAHELAHLWLGDLVTPAWWDELWLAEAFATWLGDKLVAKLDGFDDAPLRAAEARERALDADAAPDPRPLRRPVEHGDDAEAAFDAIAYDKGAAVLAMLEHWIGEGELRAAIRAYVRAHRDATATSADFIAAFATAPYAMRDVLTSYVEHPGVPVVDLALQCDVRPAHVTAALRAVGAAVPVCVRYAGAGGPAETCGVVGATGGSAQELVLTESPGCPAWVIGNADGVGYYATEWSHVGLGPIAPLATQTPTERIAYGDDIANAVARGDASVTGALAELTRLAHDRDPYALLAALAIARALQPLVDADTAPRWWTYLAAQLAPELQPDAMLAPPTPAWRAVRDRVLELVPADRLPALTVKRARAELDRALAGGDATAREAALDVLATLASADAADARSYDRTAHFFQLIALAALTEDTGLREDLYSAAGRFDAQEIPSAIAAVVAPKGSAAWPALRGFVERPATAPAAWPLVRAQLDAVLANLTTEQRGELVASVAALCDPRIAAEAAAALAPHVGDVPLGKKSLDRALAVVERCATRRARAGMAAALAR